MRALLIALTFVTRIVATDAAPVDMNTAMWNVVVDSLHPPKVYFIYMDPVQGRMCTWIDLSKPVKPLRANGVFFMLNNYQGENTAADWKICYPQ
jgi:hypothetical protein